MIMILDLISQLIVPPLQIIGLFVRGITVSLHDTFLPCGPISLIDII
jgi:hypothetical protein